VAVAGVGLVTRLGDRPEEVVAAPGEGRDVAPGPVDFDPAARFGDRNYRPLDRAGQLTVAAVEACLGSLAALPARRRIGLVVGTAFGSVATIASFDRRAQSAGPIYAKPLDFANSVINAAAGQAAIWLDLQGVNATCCGGTSSGLLALLYGADLLRGERADLVVAGGVEEHCEEIVRTTEAAGWIPTDRLGEAAAFFALLPDYSGAPVRILGGATRAAPGTGADGEVLAAALGRAMAAAVREAQVDREAIRAVSAGTGGGSDTDAWERQALASWDGDLSRFEIKRSTGECLGASAALQLLPFWAWSRGGVVAGWPDDGDALVGLVTSVDRRGVVAAAVVEAHRGR
jgi:3-oxoacyl-[acyl-carrier-protein] synthase II